MQILQSLLTLFLCLQKIVFVPVMELIQQDLVACIRQILWMLVLLFYKTIDSSSPTTKEFTFLTHSRTIPLSNSSHRLIFHIPLRIYIIMFIISSIFFVEKISDFLEYFSMSWYLDNFFLPHRLSIILELSEDS